MTVAGGAAERLRAGVTASLRGFQRPQLEVVAVLDGLDDDGGPSGGNGAYGLDAMLEELGEVVGIADADLDDEAVLADDAVHLEDLGEVGEDGGGVDRVDVVASLDHDERDESEAEGLGVQSCGVALDETCLLEFTDALKDGGGRHAYGASHFGVGGTGVLLKRREDSAIDIVDHQTSHCSREVRAPEYNLIRPAASVRGSIVCSGTGEIVVAVAAAAVGVRERHETLTGDRRLY